MHIYFDFAKQTLNQASPLIAAWAEQNHIGLFDFDCCMFADNAEEITSQHMKWVTDNYSSMAVVEMHPYMNNYDRYVEKIEMIQGIATQLNLPLTYWTTRYQYWNESVPDKTFFPGWYFVLRNHAKTRMYDTYKFPDDRNYNFSCCNMANLRKEKIYNYIECFRRRRFDWYLTIYDHPHAAISKKNIAELCSLPQEHIDIWNSSIKHAIPEYRYDLENEEILCAHSTIFPGHTDAYCNLVMEHTMEFECLSEKSFKPFIAKQIPVYVASLGAAQAISMLGFDIFYDFIDHNKYDFVTSGFVKNQGNYDNFTHRIVAVHQTIDELYKTDFRSFITRPDVVARKLKNKQHFYSDAIDHMTIQHLERLIKR